MLHASLESAGLSAIAVESDSSQSLADSISTTGPVLSVSEAVTSEALTAMMAASMAQASRASLWNTQDLSTRFCLVHTLTLLPVLKPSCWYCCNKSQASESRLWCSQHP